MNIFLSPLLIIVTNYMNGKYNIIKKMIHPRLIYFYGSFFLWWAQLFHLYGLHTTGRYVVISKVGIFE